MKYALLSIACVGLSALATYGGFEIFAPVRVPAAMRGKWVVVEGGEMRGATLEFFAGGRMTGTVPIEGRTIPIEGRVEAEGDRFHIVTTGVAAGIRSEAQSIVELSDHWLVVQDHKGVLLTMQRVPPSAAGGGR